MRLLPGNLTKKRPEPAAKSRSSLSTLELEAIRSPTPVAKTPDPRIIRPVFFCFLCLEKWKSYNYCFDCTVKESVAWLRAELKVNIETITLINFFMMSTLIYIIKLWFKKLECTDQDHLKYWHASIKSPESSMFSFFL